MDVLEKIENAYWNALEANDEPLARILKDVLEQVEYLVDDLTAWENGERDDPGY